MNVFSKPLSDQDEKATPVLSPRAHWHLEHAEPHNFYS